MNHLFTGRRHTRLKALLGAFCAIAILASTTPCAMALATTPDTASDHDCPHCPPQPCHGDNIDKDCDGLDPADKPRSDSGTDTIAAAVHMPTAFAARPPPMRAAGVGPPPARDGPRRHLLLATFNE